jgi:hypothetical protein
MLDGAKHQTPNTKLQESFKLQTSSDQACFGFEALKLKFFWSLVFGV